MKKFAAIASIFVLSVLLIPIIAGAEDMILTATVQRVVTKITKNGDPMTILFVEEQRTLNGVAYSAQAPVFASGPARTEAEQVKDGDAIKAIVTKRSNNGDTTYTLHKVIK
jgi:hypothetical protein